MIDRNMKVIENREVARDTFRIILEGDPFPSLPGQFVMLGINGSLDPFLRRPLAILKNDGETLSLLYKVKGKGTAELSTKKKGDILSVLGPLGNGFTMPGQDETVIYIAGGTGLPPIVSLAGVLSRGFLIIGARSGMDIPMLEQIESFPGVEVIITTEDGSRGRMGIATDALNEIMDRVLPPCIIYACGPNAMLKRVSEYAQYRQVKCEVSLEEHMACGFGVCSACAVKTTGGNRRVCTDGPVFDSGIIQWGR
ncbi:dihydroorotate dehydrogenase electron transfer subunit [archaeon]|nr:dihydroorotate dehydrogenase electron transfer subunit [archaeon]